MTSSNNLAGLSNYELEQRRKATSAQVEIAWMNTGSPDAIASEDLFNARMDVYDAACARLEALRSEQMRRTAMRWAGLPDMLKDAFMAGAEAICEHRKDVYPEEWWWDGYEGNVDDQAPEYAAKIMGGQG